MQRAQHDLYREFATILTPRRKLDSRADLLRQRIFRRSRAIGDQPLGEALGNETLHRLPDEFGAIISELLFGQDIEQKRSAPPD